MSDETKCELCEEFIWEVGPLECVPVWDDPKDDDGDAAVRRDVMKVECMQAQTHYLMHIAQSLAGK